MLKVLLLILLLQVASAQKSTVNCNPDDTTVVIPVLRDKNYTSQAETDVENYQNKEDDVMDYKLLTIRPPNYSEKPVDPCIQFDISAEIDGTEGTKKVVVQVQTVPLGDAFCVKSNINGFSRQCSVDEFRWCDDGVDLAKFQFECDQQSCEKSEIDLYVKVVASSSRDAGEIEYWCDNTELDYPSSLIKTKPDKQPEYTGKDPSQEKEPKKPNSALSLTLSTTLLALTLKWIAFYF